MISRYVFREALTSTVLVLVVLLVILMSNQFAEILADAASEDLPRDAIMTVLGLTFLRYLTLLMPIALLLGVMLALARLNRDSEAAAMAACGIGTAALLRPIGLLSVVAAAGVGWLALLQAPAANKTISEIRFAAKGTMDLGAFSPGSFTAIDSGRTVLYVRDAEGDQLRGVFIRREQADRVVVILAEQGRRLLSPESGEMNLQLTDGRRYEGVPGEASFFIAEFEEHGIPIQTEEEEFVEAIESRPTRDLIGSAVPEDRAELQWRLASPLSTLLLVLLAVPLSRSSPREGRFARVGVGLLLYIIYANSLSIGRVWIERETMLGWLGLWWVHGILGALALTLLLRASGALARTRIYPNEPDRRREPTA